MQEGAGVSDRIVRSIKEVARQEIRKMRLPEIGIVTSSFPHGSEGDKDNYECNVRLKNTELELRGVQIATGCIGFACAPKVGDMVLVAFVDGDINMPVVVGRLYNDQDRPPVSSVGEQVFIAPYEKDEGLRRVYLELPSGLKLKITDDSVLVSAGATRVVINREGDIVIEAKGEVRVKSEGNTAIEAKGDMTIKAENIDLESSKAMKLKSNSLDLKSAKDTVVSADGKLSLAAASDFSAKSNADLKIEGMNLEAKGDVDAKVTGGTTAKLEGGATVRVKASGEASLESDASTVVKGAIVRIN